MSFLLMLLALQAQQEPLVVESKPPRADVELTAIRQYWWPSFRGARRVDGAAAEGSRLRLVDDLNLPNDATIPMYGGGDIWVSVRQSLSEHNLLLFSAEYWSHGWAGGETLSGPETFRDHLFPAGARVQSRFHLMSLTLDAFVVHEEAPFTIGASIPIQFLSSRFRMDSPADSDRKTIRDVCWGGGVFLKVRPVPFVFAGITLKGLTSFAHAGETAVGDFKGYAGVQWGPFTLEGGYRFGAAHLWRPEEELEYVLYGPYAALSFTARF
jgi:hypothetical protein